ncbi:hypothetical protein EC957_007715 [Mortierella hygrophila]|uniref:Uncharacterized protein n=1 Tax=Mortierella hygrophila TaxID=979708 RepID=A0A9P6EYB8_9FUNG|nr:hypothetical protein EC957_007715 [Mortierella hygrophila]
MTDFRTLTHRLAIEEDQQRQIDSFQDNSNFIDQLAKEDNTATAVFAKTQMSFVVNTSVAAGQSPLLLPPATSSLSSSSSTSTSTASRSLADTPKTAPVQPLFTSMAISSAPNSTTPTTTTTVTTLTEKPPATLGGTKKPPSKTTTKTSNKPTIQSRPPPKFQIRLDRFLVSRKPSLASTPKPAVNSGTKTPEKSILKHCTACSNTNNQPPALAIPEAVKSSATSSTTMPKPKPKSRVRVRARTKPAPTPPSTKTIKPTKPTTPSLVEKRTITLHKTSRTPPSPPKPRLKANFFFGLLPPPTVTTANSKAGETLRRAGDLNTRMSRGAGEKPKNAPKTGPDASTITPPADTNVATAKLTKVKDLEPDSNDATSTDSTTATGKDVSPTEVTRRVVKSKSFLPKLKSTIASAVKAGTDKTVVPAVSKSMTTPPLVTKKTSVPVEVSSRVIKVEPSVPKSKFRPTTATPTRTTTPAPKVMATSETTSLRAVSKPTKIPCTSKNTTAVIAVSTTITHHPPVAKTTIAPAARSKKLSDTVAPSSTKATAATTIASVAPKTTASPKDASTAPKSSSKDFTVFNNPKSSSTFIITTTTSVSNDSTAVLKPSKNVTISTSAPKNNKGKVKGKNPLRTTSEVTTATKPAAQPRIVLSLSTNHHYLQNQNRQLATTTTATSTTSCQTAPTPDSHPPFGSIPPPRPKRVLELMLQSDYDSSTTSPHSNENDSPYYLRSRQRTPSIFNNPPSKNDDIVSSSNPQPQKRQRLADIITAESMAGRNHGMFGQTAFEQALDAMSFKYPTPALAPGPVHVCGLSPAPATIAATANQRLRLFLKRRREAATSTMTIGRRVIGGGGGTPRWIP